MTNRGQARFLAQVRDGPPGFPVGFDLADTKRRNLWPTVCPLCQHLEFDWSDGTDDTWSGICRHCGAGSDFRVSGREPEPRS